MQGLHGVGVAIGGFSATALGSRRVSFASGVLGVSVLLVSTLAARTQPHFA